MSLKLEGENPNATLIIDLSGINTTLAGVVSGPRLTTQTTADAKEVLHFVGAPNRGS
jgi:hypothetical protein